MKRFTNNLPGNYRKIKSGVTTTDMTERLGEYEDTGLMPSQVRQLIRRNTYLEEELAAVRYERDTAIEQNAVLAEMLFR